MSGNLNARYARFREEESLRLCSLRSRAPETCGAKEDMVGYKPLTWGPALRLAPLHGEEAWA